MFDFIIITDGDDECRWEYDGELLRLRGANHGCCEHTNLRELHAAFPASDFLKHHWYEFLTLF